MSKNRRNLHFYMNSPKKVLEDQFQLRYSKFKASFYSKIKLDDNTRKIIKFVNSMQGS